MAIDAIPLFILSARYLNITKAARELRISQSTASRRLTEFESDIGIKLFKKKGRRIELTDVGQAYFKEVSPVFSELEAVQKRYAGTEEPVTIAASHRPSKYLLPPLISEFCQTHPEATINLHTHSSIEIEKLLLDGKADLAITTNATVSASSFATEPYCREPLVAFVAANHPLARMKSLRPAEMGTIPVILKPRREGESRTEAQLRKFEKEGMRFKIVVRCDSPEVVKEFVRCGAGVGFLYYNSIKRGIESGYFRAIQFPGLDLTGQNYIVYSKEKPLSKLAGEFLVFLRASVTRNASVTTVAPKFSNGDRNGQVRNLKLETTH